MPRLRYAGALEATGDPSDAARAEFIRVQCELARLNSADDRWERIEEWEALRAREEALESRCEGWADDLPKLDGVRWDSVQFRRGFVWEVWCDDVDAFRRHAAVIFASAPIQSLSLLRARSLKPMVEVPELSRITRLIAEGARLGPAAARALAQSPNAANLVALHLSGNRLGDAGAKALAASPHLSRLDNLDLGENGIGDAGAIALAGSPVTASLSHLDLAGNLLTNVGATALARSQYLTHITGLTLWGCSKIRARGEAVLKARFGDAVSFCD